MPDNRPYRRKSWLQKMGLFQPPRRSELLFRWHPDTYIKLRDAIDELGRVEIPGWDGTELDARWLTEPPDKPWKWRSTKGDQKFFQISKTDEIVPCQEEDAESWWKSIESTLNDEFIAETRAFDRRLKCYNLIRNRLAEETYKSWILDKDGHFYEVPLALWIGERGFGLITSGIAEFDAVAYSSNLASGPILLKADFLTCNKTATEAGEVGKGQGPSDLANFPYLRFMIDAANSEIFKNGDSVPKKVVEHWLRTNWPPQLGQPTNTKITTMATYLRKPEDERGGLKVRRSGARKY